MADVKALEKLLLKPGVEGIPARGDWRRIEQDWAFSAVRELP